MSRETKDGVVVGLRAMAVLGMAGSALNAQQPGDACALLKTPETQALAGK
jgi:hypothetical protein